MTLQAFKKKTGYCRISIHRFLVEKVQRPVSHRTGMLIVILRIAFNDALLLMVQKSGIHQLRLVVYPTI